MQDIIQFTWNMNKLGHIVVVELEILHFEQVLNISHISGNQVVHPNYMIIFCYKTITEV
ncbi:hypothetical protein D3C87_1921110 [compost metagenome]